MTWGSVGAFFGGVVKWFATLRAIPSLFRRPKRLSREFQELVKCVQNGRNSLIRATGGDGEFFFAISGRLLSQNETNELLKQVPHNECPHCFTEGKKLEVVEVVYVSHDGFTLDVILE